MTETWEAQLRRAFPEWGTGAARARWAGDRERLWIGHEVSGPVVAVAHFGVWVDIGVGHPALLLVTRMGAGRCEPIRSEDYPRVGDSVLARVERVGLGAEIGLTQRPARPQTEREATVGPGGTISAPSSPAVVAELWHAARSPSPVTALVGVVLLWRSAGLTKDEAEARLTSFRATIAERAPELEDAVLDALDLVVGWCAPHSALFP